MILRHHRVKYFKNLKENASYDFEELMIINALKCPETQINMFGRVPADGSYLYFPFALLRNQKLTKPVFCQQMNDHTITAICQAGPKTGSLEWVGTIRIIVQRHFEGWVWGTTCTKANQ